MWQVLHVWPLWGKQGLQRQGGADPEPKKSAYSLNYELASLDIFPLENQIKRMRTALEDEGKLPQDLPTPRSYDNLKTLHSQLWSQMVCLSREADSEAPGLDLAERISALKNEISQVRPTFENAQEKLLFCATSLFQALGGTFPKKEMSLFEKKRHIGLSLRSIEGQYKYNKQRQIALAAISRVCNENHPSPDDPSYAENLEALREKCRLMPQPGWGGCD